LPFAALERANYYLANAAICANEDAANVLRTKGFRRPIAIIPPGLDPDLYHPRESTSGSEFQIGYVGRLVREKGVDLLIRACSTLGSAWRLRIIGDGEQAGSLRRLAVDLGLSAQVQFQGVVPSSDVPEMLRGLDTLVLPSRSLPNWREQMGRVLLEAMACGVPVVGSTCGEIPRVIGEGGLIFPEGDASELASRLHQLKDDPELRYRLGRLGRQRVMSRYTYRQISHDTTEVYRSVISAST
jgi:glycosyltransferase involved in cell wall biosynthesis